MNLIEDVRIVELGIIYEDSLIISDLHIGYERELKDKGHLIPYNHFKEMLGIIKDVILEERPERIIINGDLKHEYGKVNFEERKQINELISYIQGKNIELVLIKGNHDLMLSYLIQDKGIELHDFYEMGDLFICHGDKIYESDKPYYVIGHEHPAIVLELEGRKEKYKCFLKGKWKDKTLIVLPAFSTLAGLDILGGKHLSPYLKNIDDFEVIVAEANGMNFGTLKNLKELMKNGS